MKVGIDSIAIYTSNFALNLGTLAEARGIDPEKYYTGLGQHVMSVPPPGEDIVTMAANAAKQALHDSDLNDIEMLLFATESGTDQSKAAGLYVHELLGLPARCRVLELKQACYSATGGLQLAMSFLRDYPNKKVLLIASDIARYGLRTTGESSQGCGAAAMVLSVNPRIIAFDREYGVMSESVMDFWRPNYLDEALVEGKYSSKLYLTMLEKSWEQYFELSKRGFQDHAYYCYHTPVPKLVEKAHQHLLKFTGNENISQEAKDKQLNPTLDYSKKIGNSYSASLYVGLASLLDTAQDDLSGKRIGFYSYGSGCVAEYFSGVVQPNYREALNTTFHQTLFANRKMLNYDEYESFYTFHYVQDGSHQSVPEFETGAFRLAAMQDHKRIYEQRKKIAIQTQPSVKQAVEMKVYAPGKLILSGEHAVVYGHPALAMAVNRYATATISREASPGVLFDLADLAHHSHISLDALKQIKEKIKHKYYKFISGDYTIKDVLQQPFKLAQFALSILTDSHGIHLPHGVKIRVQSDIPIGCGMGSSAATILSVMHAASTFLQIPIPPETLYKLALEAENMQHGHSSGLDLRIAQQGGCIFMQEQQIQTRTAPSVPMYLVHTGMPSSTTGQCVEKVASQFQSKELGNDFASVTTLMDQALQQQKWKVFREALSENNRLLTRIGVVPDKVQRFISEVEAIGGAAKTCGAGAVAGDQAGVVLALVDDVNALSSICERFHYAVTPVSCEQRGVYAI